MSKLNSLDNLTQLVFRIINSKTNREQPSSSTKKEWIDLKGILGEYKIEFKHDGNLEKILDSIGCLKREKMIVESNDSQRYKVSEVGIREVAKLS